MRQKLEKPKWELGIWLLLDALTPVRKGDAEMPSNSWSDYEDRASLPEELKNRLASVVDLVNL